MTRWQCQCGGNHFPEQLGPVDEDLAVIKAIRQRMEDHECDAAAAKAEVTARTQRRDAAKEAADAAKAHLAAMTKELSEAKTRLTEIKKAAKKVPEVMPSNAAPTGGRNAKPFKVSC